MSSSRKPSSVAPAAVFLTAGLLLLLSGVLVYWVKTRVPQQSSVVEVQGQLQDGATPVMPAKTLSAFWLDPHTGRFRPHAISLPQPAEGEDLCRRYVEALLKGREGVLVPAPPQITLRAIYRVSHQNLLVLDFHEILLHTFPGGSTAELEFVAFLVNNICQNFPEIKRVKFLVEGNELTHLSGHLDLSLPQVPNPSVFLGEVPGTEP